MSYWILPKSGIPISCTTVQRMPLNEFSRDEVQKQIAEYESGLEKRLKAASAQLSTHPNPENMPQSHVFSLDKEDIEFIEEFMPVRNNDDVPTSSRGQCRGYARSLCTDGIHPTKSC